ncbi:MAG: chemotaxis protein CheX [Spirochaetales bacterium]|nr:chemotaxis protein CheX [Spirochaetales bacterium]
MEIKYINPFIEATKGVFFNFFNKTPDVKTPYLIRKEEPHKWDISAIIGIAGEARGAVVLSFSKFLATYLTSILVDREVKEIDDDVVDTLGEMVNIIAGNAKKGLEEYMLVISLPSIVTGINHEIRWPGSRNISIIGIPFHSSCGEFTLSVGLENII